jgi:hypothetical protein
VILSGREIWTNSELLSQDLLTKTLRHGFFHGNLCKKRGCKRNSVKFAMDKKIWLDTKEVNFSLQFIFEFAVCICWLD